MFYSTNCQQSTFVQLDKLWLCSTLQVIRQILANYVYCRIHINKDVLTICGHWENVLNNKGHLQYKKVLIKLAWSSFIYLFIYLLYFQDILDGVASHAMVVIGNDLWMYGGLSLSKGPLDTLARYLRILIWTFADHFMKFLVKICWCFLGIALKRTCGRLSKLLVKNIKDHQPDMDIH